MQVFYSRPLQALSIYYIQTIQRKFGSKCGRSLYIYIYIYIYTAERTKAEINQQPKRLRFYDYEKKTTHC